MKTVLTVLFIMFFVGHSNGQEGIFSVSMDKDTLMMYNLLEVTFSLENIHGDFIPPEFKGLRVISGPNVSSQFNMFNGRITQKATYTYYLEPLQPGVAEITAAGLNDGTTVLQTSPLKIVVLANPGGITQHKGRYTFEQRLTFRDTAAMRTDTLRAKLKNIQKKKI